MSDESHSFIGIAQASHGLLWLSRPPQEKEFEACKASAAGSLAYRPHSRSELATKLIDKGYDKATVDRALSRLQELVHSYTTNSE